MTTPRRPRVWVDTLIDVNMADGGSLLLDLMANAVVPLQTRTIVRWIGRLLCVPSIVVNATISSQFMSLGIGVTSASAFAAAGAAVPQPQIATDFPADGWVIREQAVLVNQQDSGTVEAWRFPEFRFDIRASRKVDRGVAFIRVRNDDLIAGTTTVKVVGSVRCLSLT